MTNQPAPLDEDVEAACEAAALTEHGDCSWGLYPDDEKDMCRSIMRAAIARYLEVSGLEAAQRDAARYRWFRTHENWRDSGPYDDLYCEELDTAIDTAMENAKI